MHKLLVSGDSTSTTIFLLNMEQSSQQQRPPREPSERVQLERDAFESIAGYEGAKERLRYLYELPLAFPIDFERYLSARGLHRCILLHGPPGCGKTEFARCVAKMHLGAFFLINGPELLSKYVGESEMRLRRCFDDAERAAESSGRASVIFIDELDSIASARVDCDSQIEARFVAQLLVLMDGFAKRRTPLIVIGATNRVEAVDEALRRPGRFDVDVLVDMPTELDRHQVLALHCARAGMRLSAEELAALAASTAGYSCADLVGLLSEAAEKALRRWYQYDGATKAWLKLDDPGQHPLGIADMLAALQTFAPTHQRTAVETPSIGRRTWRAERDTSPRAAGSAAAV
jgi:transitional endoplasmic reticulum ATPase